jgi:hypothetical protein
VGRSHVQLPVQVILEAHELGKLWRLLRERDGVCGSAVAD